jgi:K(+)-stimulated pyrophosphate-energized sodium pump
MGADLFESYVGSIVGTMVLGAAFMVPGFSDNFQGLSAVLLPLVLAAVGIVMSFLGTFFVRVKEGGDPQKALNMGEFVSSFIMIIASYFIITWMLPASWIFVDPLYTNPDGSAVQREMTALGVFWATVIGLVGGVLIGLSPSITRAWARALLTPLFVSRVQVRLPISSQVWVWV